MRQASTFPAVRTLNGRFREAARWAEHRGGQHAADPTAVGERAPTLADVADGVTVRVGLFDIVLW